MSSHFRIIAGTAAVAIFVAGALASPALFPQAFADEPQSHLLDTAGELFPAPFDASKLKKFDVTVDDSVSTQVEHTTTISKIEFGRKSVVSIVTTPTGTYSSDAIGSPYVLYPGVTATPKDDEDSADSFAFGSFTSPHGTYSYSTITSGSFTYMNSSFTPAARSRT